MPKGRTDPDRALVLPADATVVDAYNKGVLDTVEKITADLFQYQMEIGCSYCDCEDKMYKLQRKWDEVSEQIPKN